jgi:hypothetical protein
MDGMAPTPMIGLRVKPDDLAKIDARARKAKLTRTAYMVRAALGPAGEDGPDVAERLNALEKRVAALEKR